MCCARTLRFLIFSLAVAFFMVRSGAAQSPKPPEPKAAQPSQPSQPPHATVLKDFKAVSGLVPLYHKDIRLYGEISAQNLNKDFIVLISIARGISRMPVLGGMTWGFGDDWIWQFRKVDDRILIVRRNVRFRANAGSPEANAVQLAYTDSVLFALPVVTTGPNGGSLVDLTPVFMSDLPQIGNVLRGFAFSPQKSTWASVKGFKDNVELQVAATYQSGGGGPELDTVPDSRGATINIHYSISQLPSTGYTPRLADDRIGYFLTAVKDFSRGNDQDRFVRYINRWHLQKADPNAALSPPKQPIIFWIEKTVPFAYRKPIREGIEEWNKAFEKAGFVNAIEVRQQPDDATWDPEDINYNTFRWITASAGFAMGPSRVNPLTGQILDADIIFDADFINFWKQEFENFTPKSIADMCGGPLELSEIRAQNDRYWQHGYHTGPCSIHQGFARELALGVSVLAARPNTPQETEKLITQGLKEVVMHEVGHTLGLRHNFKASTLYNLDDLNNPEKTKNTGLTASVMDYAPSNLAPKDAKQGDYYSQTIGPYDYWAIEYGYKVVPGGSAEAEAAPLKPIAAKSGEWGMDYLTDEDTLPISPDPHTYRFDLGNDPVAYAKRRAKLVGELWPGLVERVVGEGEGYQKARRTFNILLSQYGTSMDMAARYIGGLYVSRSHRGDKGAKPPFTVVEAAKQREAMQMLEEHVLSDKPFQFPPELLNQLAVSRWSHWGSEPAIQPEFQIHEVILMWQERILARITSPVVLQRLHDSELKVPADQDAFTTAELLQRATKAVFAETESLKKGEFTPRKPAISSMRRNLQRSFYQRLASLAMGNSSAPKDCQTVAYSELVALQKRIDALMGNGELKLDTYSRAHLEETSSRIKKVLEARISLTGP